MEILESAVGFVVDDDLLDFNLEAGAEVTGSADSYSSMESSHRGGPFAESVEEDLEWLSNKDAFPGVETCFGILADNPELILNHQSPVSVLENSSGSSNSSASSNGNGSTVASYCSGLKVPGSFPVRPRSKRQRRKRYGCTQLPSEQSLWLNQVNIIKQEVSNLSPPLRTLTAVRASMGRRCLHCQADKTPQWRAGPMGPKTLCNACGVRYKSGRLLPEYRPASSPTFSSVLHSNSHRKVVEMRRKKQLPSGGGIKPSEACGYME